MGSRSVFASILLLTACPAFAQDPRDLDVDQLEHFFVDQTLNLPKTIASKEKARELDCQPASLKAAAKSCILSRFAYREPTDILLVVVYDQTPSGESSRAGRRRGSRARITRGAEPP